MKNYHRDNKPARGTTKVDVVKAYNCLDGNSCSVCWLKLVVLLSLRPRIELAGPLLSL